MMELAADTTDAPAVNVVVVYNPLNLSDRAHHVLDHEPGRSLAAYLDGLPADVEWHVTVNGTPYEPEVWGDVYPLPGDYVTLIPVPEGGGGGKGVLRMVAMLVVAVVAAMAGQYWVGPQLAASMGVTSTAGIAAVSAGVTAAVTVAGSTLTTAEFPV